LYPAAAVWRQRQRLFLVAKKKQDKEAMAAASSKLA
jgi:hypothetical protein